MNTINPATSNAAPASKLIPEFEPFMDSHINRPSPIAAQEIIISRRCALSTKTRGEFNLICIYLMDILHYNILFKYYSNDFLTNV
jgi:hypothetical protein